MAYLVLLLLGACNGENVTDPGQTGGVTGTALDASSGAGLSGVSIVVSGKTAQSGGNGEYALTGLPVGDQQFTAVKDGYRQHTGYVTVLAGNISHADVLLEPIGGPSSLTAEPGNEPGTIHLDWWTPAPVFPYKLYWSTERGVTPATGTRITDIQRTGYDHSGLTPGATYYYVLTATESGVEGPPSAEVGATAGNGITLSASLNTSRTGEFVTDSFIEVELRVTSVYQIVSASATVEDRVTQLSYVSHRDYWQGILSMVGVPSPRTLRVTFTATDVQGNIATASRSFEHNRKAVITIESPKPDGVALPQLRVRASCADDVWSGCTGFEATVGQTGERILAGAGRIDQDVSLATFDGQVVEIRFQATDDLGRRTQKTLAVYVDASPHLSRVAEVAGLGRVIDASSDRLLVSDTISQRDLYLGTLRIQQRATGQTTDVLTRQGLEVYAAHLAPHGAVFGAKDGTMVHVYEWRGNTLLDLGIENASAVDQPYLAWGVYNGGLHRRNLESGATIEVPGAAPGALFDVGPNGDVLYWSPGYDLKRFRNGVTTTIVPADPDPRVVPRGGLTDGVNVCYGILTPSELGGTRRFYSLALTESGIDTLAVFDLSPEQYEPLRGCLLNGGWIAYLKPATGGAVQAWVRSPSGAHTQVSFFSEVDRLEELSADGRLVFSNPDDEVIGRRYLWTPGGSASHIGSGLGRPEFIDGQLHVMMGNALLQVD